MFGGNTKITKERKFLDGSIMKTEKILHPDYTGTDMKNSFTFSEDKVKGTCVSVNQDGEKTGELLAETRHENKAQVKKDKKPEKTNSKSNAKLKSKKS